MIGPMDFTINDESGVMIEGFEREPMIRMPWHPPYYQQRCEEAGLSKAMDLLMWELDISDRAHMLPIIFTLAEQIEERHGVHLRKMSRRSLRKDMDRFAEVYNEAWSENWGFSPYSKEDLDAYAQEMQLVFDPHWFMVAETKEGETVAVAITIPDVNQVLKKMNGRLLPLGWWRFLTGRRKIDRVRVFALGVRPRYQHLGVAAALYVRHIEVAPRVGQLWGEMGWILEVNEPMNRAMEGMGGKVVKRYRLYELPMSGAKSGNAALPGTQSRAVDRSTHL
jgi:GNAT superfamily N-acetyltransferase